MNNNREPATEAWNVACAHCGKPWRVPPPARPLLPDAVRVSVCPHCSQVHAISYDAEAVVTAQIPTMQEQQQSQPFFSGADL